MWRERERREVNTVVRRRRTPRTKATKTVHRRETRELVYTRARMYTGRNEIIFDLVSPFFFRLPHPAPTLCSDVVHIYIYSRYPPRFIFSPIPGTGALHEIRCVYTRPLTFAEIVYVWCVCVCERRGPIFRTRATHPYYGRIRNPAISLYRPVSSIVIREFRNGHRRRLRSIIIAIPPAGATRS